MWRRLLSIILLGVALVKTLLSRLVDRRSSPRRFAQHYRAEGILAVSEEEAQCLARSGRCIACGKCDRVVSTEQMPAQPSIMTFVLSGTRSLPDYEMSAGDVSSFSRETLLRAEELCPMGVPIVELSRLVEGYRERVNEAQTRRLAP